MTRGHRIGALALAALVAVVAFVADLFGTAGARIDYTVVGADLVWYLQVALVVVGHVTALAVAHDRALVLYEDSRLAVRSQYWMLLVMVGYTALALWLLSQANA